MLRWLTAGLHIERDFYRMKYSVFFPKSGYRVKVDGAETPNDACKQALIRISMSAEFNPPDPLVMAEDVTWYPPEDSYMLAEVFYVYNDEEIRKVFRRCECGKDWIET